MVGSGRKWSGVVGNGREWPVSIPGPQRSAKDASGREWSGVHWSQSLKRSAKCLLVVGSGREWSGVARKHSRALAVSQRCLLTADH